MNERGNVDDSSDTGQGGPRRVRGCVAGGREKRAQRETGAPTGTEPVKGVPPSSASSGRDSQQSAIWTDSHCHLQDEPDPAATVAAAWAARVGRVVCVGTDEASSRRAVVLANELSGGAAPARSPGYAHHRAPGPSRSGRQSGCTPMTQSRGWARSWTSSTNWRLATVCAGPVS